MKKIAFRKFFQFPNKKKKMFSLKNAWFLFVAKSKKTIMVGGKCDSTELCYNKDWLLSLNLRPIFYTLYYFLNWFCINDKINTNNGNTMYMYGLAGY